MSRKALATRHQLRGDLKAVTQILRAASNALWDTKYALLPRATNPVSTAPPTIGGLVAEARRFEEELDTLNQMYRSIENRTADIVSLLEMEKQRGRAKRPWWVLSWWWDTELEHDLAMHRRQVQRVKERLDEVVFLWQLISHDVRPGEGRRYEMFMYAITSRCPRPSSR